MRGVRAPLKRTVQSRFLLPAGLLSVAALASLAMFFPGTLAGASGHSDAAQVTITPGQVTTRACGTVNVKGVTNSVTNAGNPFLSSSKTCLNGHLISYGNTAITYSNPPQAFVSAGRLLFAGLLWASYRSHRRGKLEWKGREYPVGTPGASK